MFGKNAYRAMVRFGVSQGPPGQEKVRAIDNGKSSLSNSVKTTHETIACITFEFSAIAAAALLDACDALGTPFPQLAIGFDDLVAAYRFVPCSQPQYTVFCAWRPAANGKEGSPVFYYIPGHSSGLVAAVLNFINRFPKLMVAMGRSLFALLVDQYFDDYMLVDAVLAKLSGQDCLRFIHSIVNRELDAGKHQSVAGERVGLGVRINVSRVHSDMCVIVSCAWHRCLSVLVMLRHARDGDFLPPGVASTIHPR